jgi:tetratricopeptide (TPR) repeat protein
MSSRSLGLFLMLAFLGVAALRVERARRERSIPLAGAAAQAPVQQFWETYNRAGQERAAGHLAEAIGLYQAALALKPGHEGSLYYLGNCYLDESRYREAISAYQRLIVVNPVGSRGYFQLGLVYASLKAGAPFDPKKAEQFLRRALQVDPDTGALLGVGEVALLEGEWQQAQEALQGVNTDNNTGVAAPYLLGYLSWRKREPDQAWQWFRLGVERCKVKKPPIPWSQEGEFKADPELRWQALARQSIFGGNWLRLRKYVKSPALSPGVMEQEYRRLSATIAAAQTRARA